MDDKSAYLIAIRLLARQDYSIVKMKKKLERRGFSDELIGETILELVEKRYLREELYVEARIKGLMNKQYSAEHIKLKLREEELDVGIAEIYHIFDEHNVKEEDQIRRLIVKKLPRPLDRNDYKKMHSVKGKILYFLMSKGHNLTTSKRILEGVISESGNTTQNL